MSIDVWRYYLKPLENPPQYTESEKMVMAWVIASEGSITLEKDERYQSSIHLQIVVSNTSLKFLESFLKIVKMGTIYKRKRQKETRKPHYVWIIQTYYEILHLLKEINVYLPIKREQSELCIQLIQNRLDRGVENNPHLPFSQEDWKLYKRNKQLNRKGVEIVDNS